MCERLKEKVSMLHWVGSSFFLLSCDVGMVWKVSFLEGLLNLL